jgi:cytoskeletal protein RodZ
MSSSDEFEMRGACFRRFCRVLRRIAIMTNPPVRVPETSVDARNAENDANADAGADADAYADADADADADANATPTPTPTPTTTTTTTTPRTTPTQATQGPHKE